MLAHGNRDDDITTLRHGASVLFESDVVQVGVARCPADHPDFERPGPIQRHAFYLGGSPVRVIRGGRETFLADATTVSFHNRGEEIERRPVQGRGDHSNWFAITPDYLLSTLELLDPQAAARPERPFALRQGPCPASSFLLQRLLVAGLSSTAPPDALATEEAALGLLLEVAQAAGVGTAPPDRTQDDTDARHAALVDGVKDLLAATYHAQLGLAEVAAAVGCSPYHLARIFRARTGWTLHGFRHQIRLRTAAEAVLQGQRDLAQLALEVGFSSHSHLTSAFQKAFGIAPSGLREDVVRTLAALRGNDSRLMKRTP